MVARAKEKILKAAEKLILQGCYHGTGTNAIIAEAGVSKGSFFYHFPDKSKLIQTLMETYFHKIVEAPLQQIFSKHPGAPEQALITFIEEIAAAYKTSQYRGGCLLGNIALELTDSDEEVGKISANLFARWRFMLSEFLQDIPMALNREAFIILYIAALEGVTMSIKAHKNQAQADKEFEACKQLVHLGFQST